MEKTLNLLPHQFELLSDYDTKILGLVSGVGAGKSWAIARKACLLMLANPGFDGLMCEPTYPLITQILVPELKNALDFFNISYRFNKVDGIFYCDISGVETRIIVRTMEKYERLIGVNVAWVVLDEFDTTKPEIAYKAFQKLLARLRVGNTRQMVIVSTPEGLRAMYRIFIKEDSEHKRLIKAKTTDNPYLPKDYIQSLYDLYPEELINAYINGEFVNLTSGTVYSYYKVTTCNTALTEDGFTTLHVGVDFNVGGCCMKFFGLKDEKVYLVKEAIVNDTEEMCSLLKTIEKQLKIYPDASGKNASTNSSVSDIAMLKQAGFQVLAKGSNPRVQDRVNAVNRLFNKGILFINKSKCPETISALQEQVYKNGAPEKFNNPGSIDDHNDSLGYFIHYKFPIKKVTAKFTDISTLI